MRAVLYCTIVVGNWVPGHDLEVLFLYDTINFTHVENQEDKSMFTDESLMSCGCVRHRREYRTCCYSVHFELPTRVSVSNEIY